jgi:hypothetical protein
VFQKQGIARHALGGLQGLVFAYDAAGSDVTLKAVTNIAMVLTIEVDDLSGSYWAASFSAADFIY